LLLSTLNTLVCVVMIVCRHYYIRGAQDRVL